MVTEFTQARLSIWRTFAPTAPLAVEDKEAGWRVVATDGVDGFASGDPLRLQEQVYSWQLVTDPFGGIDDNDVREDLREALFGRLHVSLPPAQRSIAVLREFVEKAERAINEGHAGPTPTEFASAAPSTYTPLEPNPLLALSVHLKWLVRCFGDRPNVSVAIR